MLPRPRLALPTALVALALIAGCKKPGRLDLLLRPSENLDLSLVAELEVRLIDDRDGQQIERATVTGTQLESLPNVFGKSSIDPDIPYAFEVRAAVDSEVCASERIVGRSLPVQVQGDDSVGSATMYVACADSFAPTGRMNEPRATHDAIWAPVQGGAILAGGASEMTNDGFAALASVERYDPATGRFVELAPLLDARVLFGSALDSAGRVFVMGGSRRSFDPRDWLDSVEEIDGETRRGKGLLDTTWLAPAVLPLEDGSVALLGIGLHGLGIAQGTLYDPSTETNPIGGYLPRDRDEQYNLHAVPMPGRGRALLTGGADNPFTDEEDTARPSLFCADGCCEDPGPCFVLLGDEAPPDPPGVSTWGAGAGWQNYAGAYLSCPQGGGTVILAGGQLGDDGPALDDVWCYHDVDGEPSTEGLTRIGSLNRARVLHGVTAIRPGRLLVLGGTGPDEWLDSAEILRVDPCGCTPFDADAVTDVVIDPSLGDLGRLLFGGSEVVLGDGSVLVTGAVSLDLESNFASDDEAWVFMPDLPD